jgi:hypothetical protein
MDLIDPNFFKLNYLCLNRSGKISNQSVIIEQSIKKQKKIQRVKSSATPNLISTPKYNKINETKILLNNKNSSKVRQTLNKTKYNNKKIFNNIYRAYYSESNRVNSIFKCPMSLSPSTPGDRENKKKKNNLNLYNEITSKIKNKRKYNFLENNSNQERKNSSSRNIFNNNFFPLTESKNNYLNIQNTNQSYINTNFFFRIDGNINNNKGLYTGINYKKYPIKNKKKK